MRLSRPLSQIALGLLCLWSIRALFAASSERPELPFLNPIFGDHMVLQRDKPNTFWGWTKPGEIVRVELAGRSRSAVANTEGRWQVQIDPPAVGTVCTVKVDGAQSIELHDVLVGDVWLCGGQSNMQFGLPEVVEGAREVAAADRPNIRLYTVGSHAAYAPTAVSKGSWKCCSPQTVSERGGFSAVAYFFACKVQAQTGVPIGLIQDCLGGTPIETWMNPETLHGIKDFALPMAEVDRLRKTNAPEYGNYLSHWFDEYDLGNRGKTWAASDFDDAKWKPVQLPGGFKEFGLSDFPAVCWFRREIVLPDHPLTGAATLHLGVVEKMDTTYVNGQWVGASSWVENPRAYKLQEGVLKPGRNVIAIRVFKLKSKTGFLSAPSDLHLTFSDGSELPLAGAWKGAVSVDARPPHPLPLGYENYPIIPSVLYNGMIQPIAPLALTGALWYQGEANSNRAHQYRTLLPAMIHDWRSVFAQGDFPFLIVSLPAFQTHREQPGSDDWAELREAQAFAARSVPNCGLAVTIDTGEADNIHPKNKRPVGERVALLALAMHYGKDLESSGPVYRSMENKGNEIRIRFDHTTGGLVVRGKELAEFSVAGPDKKWHWAEAKLEGNSAIVSSPEVPQPIAVRYAWQANPKAALFNGAGLPAAPFRTDDWPGVTDARPPW